MPWKETCAMDQKLKFVAASRSKEYSHAQLCRRFGISRKTGYKWLERYAAEGVRGLETRSRAPHHHPNALSEAVVAQLLALKHRYGLWGPKKIHDWLVLNRPGESWPAPSTIGEVFKRHGLVRARRGRARPPAHSEPFRACAQSNAVWSADFKGQFRVGTGQWCYPLTVSDNHSRYLLVCRAVRSPTEAAVWRWFEQVFRDYGVPEAIRTDNGSPFASTALGGLTRLSVWWLKLGIVPERIAAGHPEQNGRHERMHRTLKAATAQPPKATLGAQQRAFGRFIREYNEQRPHESLGGVPPARVYQPSLRPYPARLGEVDYPGHYTVRRVRHNGEIKWRGGRIYVSQALRGETVGLDEVDDERWQLYFSRLTLGILDERQGKVLRPA